jgi:hypothetical protein
MPYKTRKRLKLVMELPPVFRIDLNDDVAWNHYHYFLDSGIRYDMRGIVKLLTDKDDKVIRYVDKEYQFFVPHLRADYAYKQDGIQYVAYDRQLQLPDELVNGFNLSRGMGIELVLTEFVTQKDWLNPDHNQKIEVIKIFPEAAVSGIMDFELKGLSGEPLPESELLITSKFDNAFYIGLVSEINDVFRIGKFTAAMVLIRKLFENLVIDLLRIKYGTEPPNIDIFYSTRENRFLHFSTLIKNLNNRIDHFRPYSNFLQWDKQKDSFINFLRDIKEKGDACAHSMEIIQKADEINELKPSINLYCDFLERLIQKIRETPK